MKAEVNTHLWFITAELPVTVRQTLETDGKLHVTRADDVLEVELGELGVESEFLHDPRVLARSETRIVLRLHTRDDHLARHKDEGGRLWVTNTHDDGRKMLNAKDNKGSSKFIQAVVKRTDHIPTFKLGLYSAFLT